MTAIENVRTRPNAERGSGCLLSVCIEQSTVHAAGVLDGTTVDLLLGTAGALLGRGERVVTIDLAAVTRIDSDAVRALFISQQDTPPGITLHLRAPERLRRRLAICVLDGSGTSLRPRGGQQWN